MKFQLVSRVLGGSSGSTSGAPQSPLRAEEGRPVAPCAAVAPRADLEKGHRSSGGVYGPVRDTQRYP